MRPCRAWRRSSLPACGAGRPGRRTGGSPPSSCPPSSPPRRTPPRRTPRRARTPRCRAGQEQAARLCVRLHYESEVVEEKEASVYVYSTRRSRYKWRRRSRLRTGTLCDGGGIGGCSECARVHNDTVDVEEGGCGECVQVHSEMEVVVEDGESMHLRCPASVYSGAYPRTKSKRKPPNPTSSLSHPSHSLSAWRRSGLRWSRSRAQGPRRWGVYRSCV